MLNLAEAAVSPSGGSAATRFDTLFQQFYAELFGLVYRVLGDRMEVSLRRALTISRGDWWVFLQGAISKFVVGAIVLGMI